MKNLVIGILAHVDAGKTTLSEALLYTAGSIRKLGRVDNADAFLDTHELERARGITIFSKQAVFDIDHALRITLLDTPGHVDFSAEMERTLQVLDAAILVVSGADGIQGHTRTLWRLLERYHIPVLLFMNKMDQAGTDSEELLRQVRAGLSDNCINFSEKDHAVLCENLAMCDEHVLEHYLEQGIIEADAAARLIRERKVFPCYFGSALKVTGVEELLDGLRQYTYQPVWPEEFGAKVFKISRDEQGNRLTHLKITGGSLKVRTAVTDSMEKVHQIRLYSGEKYELLTEAQAGTVCAVTGLTDTRPGEGLGREAASAMPVLEPVLTYSIQLPPGVDATAMLPKLRQLEEEEPELHIAWNESLKEIQAQIMGEVQVEILKSLIWERYRIEVNFGTGSIVYKETIADTVEGVGHFEPLRHYAEVHLLLQPGEPGSGLQFAADVSEDELERSWQRLVLTHLEEREHRGVLTGAAITDMRITMIAGRAHVKHTEGGDFRQATYRAVRHGLMQARSVLLEPYYEFRLEIPEESTGRAMTDIEKMNGSLSLPQQEGDMAVLTGTAPVSAMSNYQKEVTAYTKGRGRLSCVLSRYEPCHNAEAVVEQAGYEPDKDTDHTADSVFCSHGAGFVVPWNQVKDYMHLESRLARYAGAGRMEGMNDASEDRISAGMQRMPEQVTQKEEIWIGTEEIDRILERAGQANRREEPVSRWGRSKCDKPMSAYIIAPAVSRPKPAVQPQEEYLLVDGYNIIFAWEELKELAKANIDGARGRLMDMLCNYQGIRKMTMIVVFDAYRVQGHMTEISDYHNIHVVFTKEAETADQYIEKFAHEHAHKNAVTVATSDGLEQVIIRGEGCRLLSASDLLEDMERAGERILEDYKDGQSTGRRYLLDSLSEEELRQLNEAAVRPENTPADK